jgi:hypothetical protein
MLVRSTRPCLFTRRPTLLALCGLICLPALSVQAQQTGADSADPSIVVMRTVHPRIAYRGIPLEDHPIQAEATTFPGRVFRGVVDGVIGSLVGDAELGERGAAGPAVDALVPLLERSTAPLGSTLAGHAGGNTPLGASATAGAVGGATRDLGSRITGALAPIVNPGLQGGGP